MTSNGSTEGGTIGGSAATPPRRLATILAADLCNYSALAEDDADGALLAIAALTTRIDDAANVAGGRLFHRAGDGFLCELPTATAGVQVARALAASLSDEPIRLGQETAVVRIGVHTGEVTEEASGDLLGHAVNVAARLQGEAPKRGVVISASTAALSEDDGTLRRLGDLKLKNMRDPITAYALVFDDGFADRLRTLTSTRWVRRNARAFVVLGLVVVAGALMLSASLVARDQALRASRAAEARAFALEAEAERLALKLTNEETRLLDKEAVEEAALALLSSGDPLKAEARTAALAGKPRKTALALKAAYAAQESSGASDEVLAQTALQAGAFASGQDQSLAQWAYEQAYAKLPREPFVLLQLADIAGDRNEDEDSRSYLSALLAINPEPRYAIEAEQGLAYLAQDQDRFDEAERRLTRALAIARATDLSKEEASVLGAIGQLGLFRSTRLDDASAEAEKSALLAEAEANYRRALRVYRALDDAAGATEMLTELGILAQMSGEPEAAAERYEEAFVLTEQMGDLPSIASLGYNLSSVHHGLGNKDRRDAYWEAARDAAQTGMVESMLSVLHVAKAGYLFGDGDARQACKQLNIAREFHRPGDMSVGRLRDAMIPELQCAASELAGDDTQP